LPTAKCCPAIVGLPHQRDRAVEKVDARLAIPAVLRIQPRRRRNALIIRTDAPINQHLCIERALISVPSDVFIVEAIERNGEVLGLPSSKSIISQLHHRGIGECATCVDRCVIYWIWRAVAVVGMN